MANEIEGIAAPTKAVESDNLNPDAFEHLFLNASPGEPENQEAESEETEEDDESEDVEETAEEEEETEETEDEAEAIDLDSLTPEQIQAIANKARSKALARYGKLTGEIKDLKAQLEQATAKPSNPLEQARKVDNPRIAAIKTIADLQSEQEQAEAVEEWAQSILDMNGAADPGDIVVTGAGAGKDKEFTKEQLVQMRNSARKALKRDIPARLTEIQSEAELVKAKEWYDAQAAQIIPEIADDASPVAATHKALMGDPNLQRAFSLVPEVAAYGSLILAHAARSIELLKAEQSKGKPKVATTKGTLPRPKAPAPPSNVGATSGNPKTPKHNQIESLKRQAEATGSPDDFANYLASTL